MLCGLPPIRHLHLNSTVTWDFQCDSVLKLHRQSTLHGLESHKFNNTPVHFNGLVLNASISLEIWIQLIQCSCSSRYCAQDHFTENSSIILYQLVCQMPILSLELSSQILCSVAQCKLEGETYKLWLFIKTCSKTCFKQKLLWSISEIQLNSLHIFLSINQKRHRGQLFTYVKAEKRIVSGLEEFTVQRKNDCH